MRRKWLGIALFASVLLNLFLGGLMAGQHLGRDRLDWDAVSISPGNILRMLPGDRAEEIRAQMRVRREELRGRYRAMGEAREGLRETLFAETVDQEKAAAAAGVLEARMAETQQAVHATVFDMVRLMTPEERARISAELEARRERLMERVRERAEERGERKGS
ncbi:periplasmic heavy metal sensor [Futiania mangrovi]|uniref:Periplasmic heavy metal sensor n=1 Tax=Futiania mangrovi TaxID=2959716 RepID=A0A9J6P8C6_9PROT|nr:periplasmic heavy metal sensor [Futiania mangrovii]MCP1335884.1 periplasmic heavy metal sensor [Futiania mangrovii]